MKRIFILLFLFLALTSASALADTSIIPEDGEVNTASNTGSLGVGIFKQKTSSDLEFFKIQSANNRLTAALFGTDYFLITLVESNIDHDALTNFVADEHIAHSSVTFTAGVGLTGGGTLAANRTFTFAPAEINAATWGDGLNASNIWTFDLSGTDITLTWGSGTATLLGTLIADGLTLGSTESLTIGSQTLTHNAIDFVFDDEVTVPDDTYSESNWDGDLGVPTKNAVRDKIETILGDVTASANLTDNSIIKGDGGVKGVQDSGVLIDDSDNMSAINNLTANGAGTFSGAGDSVFGTGGTKHDGYVITNAAEVQTANATQTVLDTVTLLDENTYHIEAFIVAVQSDGTDRASYHIAGTFYRTGAGNATIQGVVIDIHKQESNAALDATFTVSGNVVRVSVIGIAAETWEWGSTITYINMSN